MTMYLPNSDLRPTGFEPAEFIDVPPMVHAPAPPLTNLPDAGPAPVDECEAGDPDPRKEGSS